MRATITALLACLLTLSLCSPSARAYSRGLNGSSGKGPSTCNNQGCHSGGVEPLVRWEGPSTVAAGATATYTFVVQSQSPSQVSAGLDIAASDGTLVDADDATYLKSKEITHISPKPNNAMGEASFNFGWTAPLKAGTYTLFGAGNSVNLDRNSTGDRATITTFAVTVEEVAATPTPTVPAEPTLTATATPTSTPPAPPSCVGDCGGDGEVTVDEIITGVNMALGLAPVSACPVFDGSGDGEVTIDEILLAVNSALGSCPQP